MPYAVTKLTDMYRVEIEEHPDLSLEEILELYLNEMETHGWRLHSTVPDHQMWDENGDADGQAGAKLVFYSDNPEPTGVSEDVPVVAFESGT